MRTRTTIRQSLMALLIAELLVIALIAAGFVVGHAREQSTATPPSATEFRWALDEGSERILYLEGGDMAGQPTAIQILDASGAIVITGGTRALDPALNEGVCTGTRAGWPTWWSRAIPEPVAQALRRHDYETYVFQGLVDGTCQRLRLTDTGCRHHGQG
jgi:hypothetical protein